jgi:uncharacterized membrane protein
VGANPTAAPAPSAVREAWLSVRARILGGLLLVLPVAITLWVVHWLCSTLVLYVIDPLGQLVLWKVLRRHPDADLPYWFERFVAPLIAVFIALLLLYCLGFFVHSRLRRVIDYVLLRLPIISVIYKGVQQVFQTFDRRGGQQVPQRVVLIPFPHPGMKAPAFVTSTCRDGVTGKVILSVYVPTTPVPTSGYFLLVPEEDVTELSWTSEQALQAIISGGLTSPPEVSYFKGQVDLPLA